jgi:hypothetical protein
MQYTAHPKKGMNNISFLTMLDEGTNRVCKNKDSHCPW